MTTPATITHGDKSLELPFVEATQGNNGYDIGKLMAADRRHDVRHRLRQHGRLQVGDHLHRRRRGHPALPRLPDRAAGREVDASWRRPTSCSTASCPTAEQLDRLHRQGQPPHGDRRAHARDVPHLPAPLAPDARAVGRRHGAGPVLAPTRSASSDEQDRRRHATGCMAKVPTLAAYGYKNSIGQPTLYPDYSLSYVENFLRMSFGAVTQPVRVRRRDHQGARRAADPARRPRAELLDVDGPPGRLGADEPLRSRSPSGVNALYGPLHGGANQAVLEMLRRHRATAASPSRSTSTGSRTRTHNERLMGFGHRVYKNYDPRAAIIKKHADAILRKHGGNDQLLDIALELEEAALSDAVLRRAQAVPERRLLHGPHLPRDGLPDRHVHGAVRHRTPPRLDRPVARDDQGPGHQDRPSAPDLRRRDRARLRRRWPTAESAPLRLSIARRSSGGRRCVRQSGRPLDARRRLRGATRRPQHPGRLRDGVPDRERAAASGSSMRHWTPPTCSTNPTLSSQDAGRWRQSGRPGVPWAMRHRRRRRTGRAQARCTSCVPTCSPTSSGRTHSCSITDRPRRAQVALGRREGARTSNPITSAVADDHERTVAASPATAAPGADQSAPRLAGFDGPDRPHARLLRVTMSMGL